jgi:signal transduction histidine kinase
MGIGGLSLRMRILLLVLLGAVLPLAVAGFWLNRSAVRQAEDLLASQLVDATESAADEIRTGWMRRRSRLLSLAESPALSEWPAVEPGELAGVEDWLVRGTVTDLTGDTVFQYPDGQPGGNPGTDFPVPVVVRQSVPEPASGRPWRTLEAELPISALMDEGRLISVSPGTVLGAFDPASGASFLPLPFDPEVLEADRFQRGGQQWISARSMVREPPILLVAAAPLDPIVQPFRTAASQGLWILGILTAVVIVLVTFFARRLTLSIETLTEAAESISKGDLDRSVASAGSDEIGRLSAAFNTMTSHLRRTLTELSEREALAAVGAFATSMAHDVRNALTSIRLDLQLLEEDVPRESRGSRYQSRALRKLEGLNRRVTGSLALARSGRIGKDPVDPIECLRSAVDSVRPEFESRGVWIVLDALPSGPLKVRGDAGILEQAFFNLLLNAAQAVASDGVPAGDTRGEARVGATVEVDSVRILFRDTGPGIPDELLDRVAEPFFSTRSDGTGLGLAIAHRAVRAHGGTLKIRNREEGGAEVEVRLPLS